MFVAGMSSVVPVATDAAAGKVRAQKTVKAWGVWGLALTPDFYAGEGVVSVTNSGTGIYSIVTSENHGNTLGISGPQGKCITATCKTDPNHTGFRTSMINTNTGNLNQFEILTYDASHAPANASFAFQLTN